MFKTTPLFINDQHNKRIDMTWSELSTCADVKKKYADKHVPVKMTKNGQ